MATFVDSPGCAAALVNFHSPVIAVGREREHIREGRRCRHSTQHSNEKYVDHFSFHETPFCFLFMIVRFLILFMARAVDFGLPLGS